MSEQTVPDVIERPLNTTQMRALQKLVKNDYDSLLIDIRRAAAQRHNEVEAEIRKQWAVDHPDSSADFLAKAMDAAGSRYNTTANRLRQEAAAAGVRFSYNGRQNISLGAEATDEGLERAVQTAQALVRAQQRDAEQRVAKQQNETERKILLASITVASEALLTSLPSGAEMLALSSGEGA